MISFFFVCLFYSIREICDDAEAVVPAHLWTIATYKELQFIDQHQMSE